MKCIFIAIVNSPGIRSHDFDNRVSKNRLFVLGLYADHANSIPARDNPQETL